MIVVYTALIFVLGAARILFSWRTRMLERKYARVAREVDGLLKQPAYRDGNSNRLDPLAAARRGYVLGLMVQKRDQVEAKFMTWQRQADRFKRDVAHVQSWKGKTLPYTLGAVDIACVLGLIDHFGFRDAVSLRALLDYVTAVFKG